MLKELQSAEQDDLKAFDKVLFGHIGHFFSQASRSILLGATDGRLVSYERGKLKRPVQLISRYSSQLAFLADFAMISLGASLKRREKISARLGDVLSLLYLASSVIKQYHDDGRQVEDWPVVDWALQDLFYQIEDRLYEIITNIGGLGSRLLLKAFIFPAGRKRQKVSDKLGQKVSQLITNDTATRKRLAPYIYSGVSEGSSVHKVEEAFKLVILNEKLEKQLLKLRKKGKLSSLDFKDLIDEALSKSFLTNEEAAALHRMDEARSAVIAVDEFTKEALFGLQAASQVAKQIVD